MADLLRRSKISPKLRTKVLVLIAGGYTAHMITDYFKENYNIDISIQNIYQNYINNPRYKGCIRRITAFLERNIAKHPLAKKINRLNIIQEAINEAFIPRVYRIYYDNKGREIARIMKRNIASVSKLIEQARKEVEGDKLETEQHFHSILSRVHDLAQGKLKLVEISEQMDSNVDPKKKECKIEIC